MTHPIIRLSGLDKFYGEFQALSQINLDIETGEFFSLLGPSGCGNPFSSTSRHPIAILPLRLHASAELAGT